MMNTRRNADAIRQLMKSPVWADDGAVKLYLYCLAMASHNQYCWRGLQLQPGDMPLSERKTAKSLKALCWSRDKLRRRMRMLEAQDMVTIQSMLMPAPMIMDVLKKHKRLQTAHRLEMGPAWNDGGFPNLVFTHQDGSHLSQPTVWKALPKILEKAGLENHRFHDLRHPYVKPATKKYHLQKQKSQATNAYWWSRIPAFVNWFYSVCDD